MAFPERLLFLARRLRERLWVRPLAMCLLSIAAVFLAKSADGVLRGAPAITPESVEALLSIMAASMLVIATFAVASMVAAYASAGQAATPRAFRLIVADDVSQNALSTFVGAFIFSIVALTAVKNDFYGPAGLLALFGLTASVFAVVILTFVRWVDRIARLGRLGTSIEKVEAATRAALERRRVAPSLGGAAADQAGGTAIEGKAVGYVQQVDVAALQAHAERAGLRIAVSALPGKFVMPGQPLARVAPDDGGSTGVDADPIRSAFVIGSERLFDDDPRYGLVVLSEIADKALSPGINDSGTAIAVLGCLARLLVFWAEPDADREPPRHDRISVPVLSMKDMFDDAFTAIARDGAGSVEVAVRLQKVLASLACAGSEELRAAALVHSRLALARAEKALSLPEDLAAVRSVAPCVARP